MDKVVMESNQCTEVKVLRGSQYRLLCNQLHMIRGNAESNTIIIILSLISAQYHLVKVTRCFCFEVNSNISSLGTGVYKR